MFAPAETKRSTTNIGSEQPQMHNYGSRKARADASVLRTPTCTRAFGAEARATWVAAEPLVVAVPRRVASASRLYHQHPAKRSRYYTQ